MTSLQRAATSSSSSSSPSLMSTSSQLQDEKTRTNTSRSSSGVFETCFGGLDLSEFTENTPTTSSTCASAHLMKLKALEAQKAAMDAKEESILRENAAQKVREEEERLQRKKEEEEMVERGAMLLLPPPAPTTTPTTSQNVSCLYGCEVVDPFFPSSSSSHDGSDGKEFISKGNIYSALVQMHGADETAARGNNNKKRGTTTTTTTTTTLSFASSSSSSLSSPLNSLRKTVKPQRRNALINKTRCKQHRGLYTNNNTTSLGNKKNSREKKSVVKKGKRIKY